MTRRNFITSLGAIGLFNILPGAGRVWRVERPRVEAGDQWIRAFFFGERVPLSDVEFSALMNHEIKYSEWRKDSLYDFLMARNQRPTA